MNTTFRRIGAVTAATALAFGLSACSVDEDGNNSAASGEKSDNLTIFATTGYLGDAVKNIDPDADITVMVGPGGDPHTYQPTSKDMELIQQADLVVWNGLHLEAQMLDELEQQGDRQINVGDSLAEDLLLPWDDVDAEGNQLHDPHIWNSPNNWIQVVNQIGDKLEEIDPDNADKYAKNVEKYTKEVEEADAYVEEKLSSIPDDRRILVTGHDAFNYLGKEYNLEILATDFVTSESEKTSAEINELAEFIAENKIPAIFQDNLKNPQAIKSLQEAVEAKGWKVKISDDELYADTLGSEPPVNTYIGVLKHNADAISKALS
ncbi:metal ABC transporter substrate-binding protein [Corynebacterium sp. TAE3-ERU12]|uniref:metal ABC transporter substrate-binding protein n=1 Tax=Corynebacterium sp. TAE3-ERU12 TaxID=2849491 RepID=UPI002104F3FB|nr:metal ABC transporter substrate-binding protein [Corynebacterium sp. TAE3-ERU12]